MGLKDELDFAFHCLRRWLAYRRKYAGEELTRRYAANGAIIWIDHIRRIQRRIAITEVK